MKLPIRSQHLLGAEDRVVRLRVFCPGQRRSFDFEACRVCPRTVVAPDAPFEPGACLECTPDRPSAPRLPTIRSSLEACAYPGHDESVGALAAPRVVCVHENLPIERLPAAFAEWPGVELPVVDESGRLVGTIWREDFAPARRSGQLRAVLDVPRRAADRTVSANVLHESMTIEHAVEVLATRRARTLVIVDGDNVVVGVLSDLDLLRWLTHARRDSTEVSHGHER